jgi:hypothetical protein
MAIRIETENENALEMERRRLLLEAANVVYAKMWEDSRASIEFDEETLEWDATLLDGL